MTPTTKGKGNFRDVNIRNAAAGHQVDLVLHLRQSKDHLEVFHLHKLVHQDSKVADVFFPNDLRNHHFETVYDPRSC